VSKKAIACPDCGLPLQVNGEDGTLAQYDADERRRVCRRLDLDSPLWCLLLRDGTSPVSEKAGNPVSD
jgi:hypothetical protein